MVCGRVRGPNYICITGNSIGQYAFVVDESVKRWDTMYERATSHFWIARMATHLFRSGLLVG